MRTSLVKSRPHARLRTSREDLLSEDLRGTRRATSTPLDIEPRSFSRTLAWMRQLDMWHLGHLPRIGEYHDNMSLLLIISQQEQRQEVTFSHIPSCVCDAGVAFVGALIYSYICSIIIFILISRSWASDPRRTLSNDVLLLQGTPPCAVCSPFGHRSRGCSAQRAQCALR